MKKYLPFIIFIAFSICSYAQSLELLTPENSTNVTNTTYIVQGTVAEDELIATLHVRNKSASAIDVKVRRINQNIVSGTENALCWGTCYSPVVNLSPTQINIAAGATNTADFAGHYSPNAIAGVSTVMYSFFNTANPSDSVWVIIQFDVTSTGVETLFSNANFISNPYPAPANSYVCFNYSTKSRANGFIAIHNILGETIKKVDVYNAGMVKFNTSDLKQGAYIVTFVVEDKVIKTSRFLIAH